MSQSELRDLFKVRMYMRFVLTWWVHVKQAPPEGLGVLRAAPDVGAVAALFGAVVSVVSGGVGTVLVAGLWSR